MENENEKPKRKSERIDGVTATATATM